MRLELGTVMVQWAAGGLGFLWVTSRRREVGLGYGWLLRMVYAGIAGIGVAATIASGHHGTAPVVVVVAAAAMAASALVALGVSIVRRGAGVRGPTALRAARRERVAEMLGDDRRVVATAEGAEFPPALDLIAPAFGIVALLAAASADGGPFALTASRFLVGAAFLGVVSDAMLLGHWYLTQPGLGRGPIKELVRWLAIVWPIEVLLLLIPTGMVQALDGAIDDGYNGLLGWIWLLSAASTIVLTGVTWAALKERSYSAVMAATGLLYLAILTAFGTDLVARAILTP